jgi:glycosyltransferase involved in cell wall biosynthesis
VEPSRQRPAKSTPRVLLLSGEIPQTRNAGAIVLYRLLRGYGLEARGERGQPEAAGSMSLEIGEGARTSSYELPSSASRSVKLFVIGPRPHAGAEVLDCPYRELRMPLARFDNTRFSVLKRSLTACRLTPLPSHRKIKGLLGAFRPEVLVCVMIDTPWMLTAERVARKLGIPLVLVVHDINEEFEKVFPWAKKALFERNRDVYRAASRRLCVSPEMAEFLEQRYGVPGEVMYPNRSEELQPRAAELSLALRAAADQGTKGLRDERDRRHEDGGQRSDAEGRNADSSPASVTLTLGYAGSLAYGYGEALVDLIPVLREVGTQILISTPRPPENLKALLEATDVVEWMPHRADINEMWRTMQERADVMVLPYMNPAGSNEQLYRTHFPSKLTEYLALGMPVVVSGPEEAAGLRYAQGRKQEPEAGRPEMGRRGDQTGDRGQETGGKEARHEAIGEGHEAKGGEGNFERGHFDILKMAPNGAVPCTTREELVAVLRRLKMDGALRRELAQRAVEAGKRDFDPVAIRNWFIHALAATTRPSV